MKKILAAMLAMCMVTAVLSGCDSTQSSSAPAPAPSSSAAEPAPVEPSKVENEKLVVGFAQIGQESGWRDAETADLQWYAAQNIDTIDFKFADAQQKQENQIKAIKSFIDMGVDVIGLAPVVETGWDAVLTEAKEAGIPVVFLDRSAAVADDLYATFIGADFELEGRTACDEMATLLGAEGGKVVELVGTVGATAAIGRQKGFTDQLANHPEIEVIDSQSGDFTRAKGKEVMESFLKTYGAEIKGVYAHNDDMMLGAIEAIKEAGFKPGEDIKTVSIDGVKAIFEAMAAGEANVNVECNPLLGEIFFTTAAKLKAGEAVDHRIVVPADVHRAETAAEDLPNRKW